MFSYVKSKTQCIAYQCRQSSLIQQNESENNSVAPTTGGKKMNRYASNWYCRHTVRKAYVVMMSLVNVTKPVVFKATADCDICAKEFTCICMWPYYILWQSHSRSCLVNRPLFSESTLVMKTGWLAVFNGSISHSCSHVSHSLQCEQGLTCQWCKYIKWNPWLKL